MDVAVSPVEAHLHVNGCFSVCEHPVVEAMSRGGYREATDLDVLAARFPGAAHGNVTRGRSATWIGSSPAAIMGHPLGDGFGSLRMTTTVGLVRAEGDGGTPSSRVKPLAGPPPVSP
jgi:hypothetical protein